MQEYERFSVEVGIFGAGGREGWVADSRATSYVPGDPSGMVECQPPLVDRRSLLLGDMRPSRIECFGKLTLTLHCVKRDVHGELIDTCLK